MTNGGYLFTGRYLKSWKLDYRNDTPKGAESGKGSGGWLKVSHGKVGSSQLLGLFRNQQTSNYNDLEPVLFARSGSYTPNRAAAGLLVTLTMTTQPFHGCGLTQFIPLLVVR